MTNGDNKDDGLEEFKHVFHLSIFLSFFFSSTLHHSLRYLFLLLSFLPSLLLFFVLSIIFPFLSFLSPFTFLHLSFRLSSSIHLPFFPFCFSPFFSSFPSFLATHVSFHLFHFAFPLLLPFLNSICLFHLSSLPLPFSPPSYTSPFLSLILSLLLFLFLPYLFFFPSQFLFSFLFLIFFLSFFQFLPLPLPPYFSSDP